MKHKLPPIDFARALRRSATSSETQLWQFLRNRQRCGKKFRRQHPVGIYTADFSCAEAKLVVELDGAHHHTAEGIQYDARRDEWLRENKIEVLRLGGWNVEAELRQALEQIDAVLVARCPA